MTQSTEPAQTLSEDPMLSTMQSKVSAAHSISMLMLYNANQRLRRLCFDIGDELIKHNRACDDDAVPLPERCVNLANLINSHATQAVYCIHEWQQVVGYLNAFVLVVKGEEVILDPLEPVGSTLNPAARDVSQSC